MSLPSQQRRATFWAAFGPGLLWAATAIGVSHLVQSTRAGAEAGLALAGVILLALVLKYPLFEYGPRYGAATGLSLVEGYRHIGRWALWLYVAITVTTSVVIQAAIVLFTAFLLNYTFDLAWSMPVTGAVLLLVCAVSLWIGRFPLLDRAVKLILVVLALSTIAAAVVTLGRVDWSTLALLPALGTTGGAVSFAFLLALVGWMPSAIDIAVWSSLWTLAKDKVSGGHASVSHARLDFFIGYAATGFLAFCFLILGAGVMFASGMSFSGAGTVFSTQLVHLYSSTLGPWARPIVLIAALTTMLSTSLAVVDGRPAIAYFDNASVHGIRYIRAEDASGTAWGTAQSLPVGGSAGWSTRRSRPSVPTSTGPVLTPILIRKSPISMLCSLNRATSR